MKARITYANVAATLALFLALGGTSYALTVTGKTIKDGSITGKDVRKNSLKPSDIKGLGAHVVVRPGTVSSSDSVTTSFARCDPGESLISGGYYTGSSSGLPSAQVNGPLELSGTPSGWLVEMAVEPQGVGHNFSLTAYALCAS
jgi:hypothetical protein